MLCFRHVEEVKVKALVQGSSLYPDMREGRGRECCEIVAGVMNEDVVGEVSVEIKHHEECV